MPQKVEGLHLKSKNRLQPYMYSTILDLHIFSHFDRGKGPTLTVNSVCTTAMLPILSTDSESARISASKGTLTNILPAKSPKKVGWLSQKYSMLQHRDNSLLGWLKAQHEMGHFLHVFDVY